MACDVCNVFEYANRRNKSYLGVFYRHRFFNGYSTDPNRYYLIPQDLQNSKARTEHVPEGENNTSFYRHKSDYEMYQTFEIRGNYAYKKHWNFQAIVPYVVSQLYYKQVWQPPKPIADSVVNINGFGDAIILADYTHTFEPGWIRHVIKPGIGVKLPTGMYTASSNGKTYGYDIQPGTGSYDILGRFNYMVTNDTWGVDLFLNYRYCTEGKNNVKFGNKWNAMANVYYTIKVSQVSFLPKTGAYYEFSEKDRRNDIINQYSGGYSWFYQYGIDIMFKQMIFQVLFQKPFAEQLNGPVIGNAGRLTAGLVYNFD